MVAAIIVAAGSSRRMGFDKLGAELCGLPVLRRTLGAFERCNDITSIIVVASEERRSEIESWEVGKLHCVVEGGAARHHSVSNGLDALPDNVDFVAVHDGARPLITPEAISQCISVAKESGAASLARPVTDTIKRVDGERAVSGSVDRIGLWAMETPQVFKVDELRAAYRRILEKGESVTDEVSAMQAIGGRVYLVECESPNLKITFPNDIGIAEAILNSSVISGAD